MASKVQSQQPQPLRPADACVGAAIGSGGHEHGVFAVWSLAAFRQAVPVTLNLHHSPHHHHPSSYINLEEPFPLPLGWQKFLNLKTGEIYYTKSSSEDKGIKMSRRNGSGPKLDLKLNLSPPRANPQVDSPNRSATRSPTSPQSSCVSSEVAQDETLRYSNSPEAASMVLVGCPRCLMYVMLAEEDPKCPKCKSTVLLDVLHENSTTKKTNKS